VPYTVLGAILLAKLDAATVADLERGTSAIFTRRRISVLKFADAARTRFVMAGAGHG